MLNELSLQFKMRAASRFNVLVYRLQQLPLIGQFIPSHFYGADGAKISLTWLQTASMIGSSFLMAALYYYLGAAFLGGFLLDLNVALWEMPLQTMGLPVFIVGIYWLNMGFGNMLNRNVISSIDRNQIVQLKVMRDDPVLYYSAKQMLDHSGYFLYNGTVLAIYFASLSSYPWWAGYGIALVVIGTRMLSQYVDLLFDRQATNAWDAATWESMIEMVILTIACVFLFYSKAYRTEWFEQFFIRWTPLWGGALTLVGSWLWRRTDRIVPAVQQRLSVREFADFKVKVDSSRAANVKVKEGELERQLASKLTLSDKEVSAVGNKRETSGITYLNELFYARFGRLFWKRVLIRMAWVIGGGGIMLLGMHVYQDEMSELFFEEGRGLVLPQLLLMVSYVLYVGEQLTKYTYYYLDRTMLRYNFYRKPAYIYEGMRVRFKKGLMYNAPILGVVILVLGAVYYAAGGQSVWELFYLCFQAFILMLFFTYHYLLMYYLVQPYTSKLEEKSLIYTFINVFIYILIFFIYPQLVVVLGPTYYVYAMPIVLAGMLIYLVVASLLIKKVAPKNFKRR